MPTASSTRLDKAANIAVIVAAMFTVVVYARAWLTASPPPRTAPAGYTVGEVLPPLDGVSYAASDRSLILFVSSGCHFCTESMPFYGTMVSTRNARNAHVALIAVSRESPGDLRQYLAAHGVTFDRAMSTAGRSDLKFLGTPTMVLVDRKGAIQQVWVGALQPDQQQQVLRMFAG